MDNIKNFFGDRKNLTNLLFLGVLVLALPIGISLVRQQQLLTSRASVEAISFVEGQCVVRRGNNTVATCADVAVALISPIGGPSQDSPSTPPGSCDKKKFDENTWQIIKDECDDDDRKVTYQCQGSKKSKTFKNDPSCTNQSPAPSASVNPSASPTGACDPKKFDPNTWTEIKRDQCEKGEQKVTYQCQGSKKTLEETCVGSSNQLISDAYAQEAACKPNKFDKKTWTKGSRECVSGKEGRSGIKWTCQNSVVYKDEKRDDQCKGNQDEGQRGGVTQSFKIAENPVDLASTSSQSYDQEPVVVNHSFSSTTPGVKTLFVEFKGVDRDGRDEIATRSAQINLVGPDPTISSISCNLRADQPGINVKVMGLQFGSDQGSIKTEGEGNTPFNITSWSDSQASGFADLPGESDHEGKSIKIVLNRSDGARAEGVCSINGLSQLYLGPLIFCRTPNSLEQTNVDVVIAESTGSAQLVRERVSIDRAGLIQGLRKKFEISRNYVISIRAPQTLRRQFRVVATEGTVQIPDFVLPVGDIFPANGDGQINTLDRAELNRQWGLVTSRTPKSGDFNKDDRVNSVDWACMRHDFGKSNDPEAGQGGI